MSPLVTRNAVPMPTVSKSAPSRLTVPVTATLSYAYTVPDFEYFAENTASLFKARFLVFRVPTVETVPGNTLPPLSSMVCPLIVPVPPTAPPLMTRIFVPAAVLPVLPITRLPASTVVLPVQVFVFESVRIPLPKPDNVNPPLPEITPFIALPVPVVLIVISPIPAVIAPLTTTLPPLPRVPVEDSVIGPFAEMDVNERWPDVEMST